MMIADSMELLQGEECGGSTTADVPRRVIFPFRYEPEYKQHQQQQTRSLYQNQDGRRPLHKSASYSTLLLTNLVVARRNDSFVSLSTDKTAMRSRTISSTGSSSSSATKKEKPLGENKRYPACINFPIPVPTALTNGVVTFQSRPYSASRQQQQQTLPSILRSSDRGSEQRHRHQQRAAKEFSTQSSSDTYSVKSGTPSLDASSVSSSSSSSDDDATWNSDPSGCENNTNSSTAPLPSMQPPGTHTATAEKKSNSIDRRPIRTGVCFDACVRVRVFDRDRLHSFNGETVESPWFTKQEMADFRTAAIQRIVEYNSMAAAATTTTTGGISIAEYTAIVTRNGSGRYNNNIIISHGTPVPTATNYYSPSRINNKNNNQPLSFQPSSCHKKVLFTHKALSCYSDDDDEDDATQDTSLFDSSTSGGGGAHVATRSRLASAAPVWNGSVLRSMNYGCVNSVDMIQTILIVDSSLVCLSLFAKGLHWMLPHATITLARTQDEALKYFAGVNFDVVIVEERLKPIARSQHSHHRHHQSHHHYHRNRHDHSGTNSGSGLLREMMQQRKKECRYRHSNNCLQNQEILYIGVSAHFDADATKLREHGADVVWPKPPPLMDCHLRDDILQVLHRKRGTKR